MKILYTNKYVEIKACKEKKYLEINQRQPIQDTQALDRLSKNIKFYTDVTKYDSIVFTINNTDFTDEFNLFKDQYFSDIQQSGIKNLLLVIDNDTIREIYQHELNRFHDHSGLTVEYFKDEENAIQWISYKPKEIHVDQWNL